MGDKLATLVQSHDSLLLVFRNTVCVYLFLVAGFRILGRRQMAQLNPTDQVVLLLMGSAVETSLVAGNTSLLAGLVSCSTLLGLDYLLNRVFFQFKHVRHWMLGGPVLVIHNGQYVDDHIHKLSLTRADIDEALRKHGCCDISEVRFAVVEPGGDINIVQHA